MVHLGKSMFGIFESLHNDGTSCNPHHPSTYRLPPLHPTNKFMAEGAGQGPGAAAWGRMVGLGGGAAAPQPLTSRVRPFIYRVMPSINRLMPLINRLMQH